MYGVLGICAAVSLFGKFYKGYSLVWLYMPFIPFGLYYAWNMRNPPIQDLENVYRYIIAKRQATCEFQNNETEMKAFFDKHKEEARKVEEYLSKKGDTLYHLERDLVEAMSTHKIE